MAASSNTIARVPLRLTREQSSLAVSDSAESTAQTARIMCEHIRRDAYSPIVRALAARICAAAHSKTAADAARAVWLYVKQRVRFVHHEEQIARLFGERDQLQLLIAPAALLQMADPAGDCAIFTMLVCALLTTLGIRAQVVCLCCDIQEPARFSHVYSRAWIPESNSWLALDASHGSHPGWKVPARDTFREQQYDTNGNCAADIVTRGRA
jgi:transglutaminase-like putative cysteine protease